MTQLEPSSQNRQVCNVDNDEELLALKNGDNVRAYCNLDINGKSVNFMLDCGATCNVLSHADATVINRKSADLKPPKSRLSMYDGTEFKTLGKLTAEVVHQRSGKRCQMDFYVAHDRTILRSEACKAIDLITINMQNICTVKEMRTSLTGAQSLPPLLTKDFIIERYTDIFDGVGLLDGEVHLEVDWTVPPVQLLPRQLPVAIKERVKAELVEMCRNGII